MNNWEIAQIFNEIADLLDILGESPYKSRAYRRAAHKLSTTYLDAVQLSREGRLQEIPGIGDALAKKIQALITTGKLRYYDELREKVPASLRQLLQIPGIGAKTAQIIYQNLKPRDLAELETAAREKRLRELPGIGSKTEEAILRGLETLASSKKRLLLHYAFAVAGEIKDYLKSLSGIKEASIAGSLRRGMETVGDLDFVAVAHDPLAVIKELATAPFLQELLTADNFQLSLMTKWGIRADILVVQPEYYATALQYMTGSKEHNEELSALASSLGWESSENGIYPGHGEPLPSSEEELYSILGMLYIPPELREGRGEIKAASKGVLPYLLEVYDLKGDLHVHSHWSDGVNTLEELALEARRRGYQYLAVTDHSKSLHVARGLTEERIWEQREEIHRINQRLSDFRLLAGIEVEIRPDGSLDFDDDLLAEMDIVVASVHSGFNQDEKTLTERVVRAMQNKHVDIIGHPTGRLLGRREPYPIDIEQVLEVAAATGTALEINSSPDRLDLSDRYIRRGKELGVRFAVNTDAHDLHYLDDLQYGVLQARRGWLEKDDVINTMSYEQLSDWLQRG